MRDAFGRLITDPSRLTREQRVDVLADVAGRLLADADVGVRWLGRGLRAWLESGTPLESALGVRAERGSRKTAPGVARQRQQAAALMRLSVAAGGDSKALRLLRGDEACSPSCAAALEHARALRCGLSRSAFTRARRFTSSR